MKSRPRFTQEQRMTLLEGYATSNLSARHYASLHCVGFSTLAKWARQEGVSLRRKKKEPLADCQKGAEGLKSNQQNSQGRANEVFSFIDMTGYVKGIPFDSGVVPPQTCESSSGRSSSFPSCGMEIRLSNGITIKVDQVSPHEFWPQVIGFVRAFA
eukprot:TRINITY_DN3565_c0_g2_i1.p2 TRINITY_DN3565_c0_g2~~TRINITY_DN3565_c0_g2_i1.p2  ORF type:complete len:156 (+),score=12.17 TRINITY_DN3565_c0_g2_i1:2147-2614(+)